MRRRCTTYVDEFNLYYGALKGSRDKWLDLAAFFRMVRRADELTRVHYFTALVTGDGRERQQAYLRALATTPLVNVQLGRFKSKSVECRVEGCGHGLSRVFNVPAEKRTDVNIALQMLEDAYENRCDVFVVVSGDSDLVPAVHRVRSLFPSKRVIVYVPARDPTRSAAVELRAAAHDSRDLPLHLLKRCQFPAAMPDDGGELRKPADW